MPKAMLAASIHNSTVISALNAQRGTRSAAARVRNDIHRMHFQRSGGSVIS